MVMEAKQVWPEYDADEWPGLRIHFKGGPKIPKQSADEATLQTGLMGYAGNGLTNAGNLQTQGMDALNGVAGVDWGGMLNNYNNTMSGVSSGYNNLSSGILPSQYADARRQALSADLDATIGSKINNLNSRGLFGDSSPTRAMLNDVSRNASDTLARNFSSDMGAYSNLLGQQANNAGNVLGNTAQAQQNSYFEPSQLFGYASNMAAPGQNMYNTMYSGRMGQAQSGGDGGKGAAAQIGSALIMACFVAGTKIATPDGDKNIEDIKVGDKVYSFDNIETVTFVQDPIISPDDYLTIKGERGTQVTTTSTQPFVTTEGEALAPVLIGEIVLTETGEELIISIEPAEKELVYDLSTTGENIYFANGFAVKGRE
jgi:hypothetical protein